MLGLAQETKFFRKRLVDPPLFFLSEKIGNSDLPSDLLTETIIRSWIGFITSLFQHLLPEIVEAKFILCHAMHENLSNVVQEKNGRTEVRYPSALDQLPAKVKLVNKPS